MSRRRFATVAIAWGVALLLALSPLGAMVGFMAAFGVAMYGGAAGVALLQGARLLGFDPSWAEIGAVLGYGTAGLLAFAILVLAAKGWLRWRRGEDEAALSAFAGALSLVAAPAALLLSVQSLEKAWPL
jgi:hypothetical protein